MLVRAACQCFGRKTGAVCPAFGGWGGSRVEEAEGGWAGMKRWAKLHGSDTVAGVQLFFPIMCVRALPTTLTRRFTIDDDPGTNWEG